MNNLRQRKAFTIVEMVIVIAVIAILSTVLVPTISGIIQKDNFLVSVKRYCNDICACTDHGIIITSDNYQKETDTTDDTADQDKYTE